MRLVFSLLLTLGLGLVAATIPSKDYKPDVFITTDISNEPDDAESLVRALLYANEVSIRGIVATTSFWLNYTVHDEDIYPILDAYEQVYPNLVKHDPNYPTADYLRGIVAKGKPKYGMAAVNDGKPISQGAHNLIDVVDGIVPGNVIHVLLWGGANVLAEALNEVKDSRSEEETDLFISKISVYAVSDQDDSGAWIRHTFPRLKYIVSITGWNQYGHAAWVGISGEVYNHFDVGGPESYLVSKYWLQENIMSVGPLGQAYPEYLFNMKGDTPSFLSVIPNGLNFPEHPEYGGWGGRYIPTDLSGRFNYYGDAQDYVLGNDGKIHVSNKASIWRWREAYQNDFAARMQWTVKEFEESVHAPIVIINGSQGINPLEITGIAGSIILLDASESFGLDKNQELRYKWLHYRELTLTQGNIVEVPEIQVTNINKEGSIVQFKVPEFESACFNIFGRRFGKTCKQYHFVLEVMNSKNGISASAYRRIIVQVVKGEKDVYPDEVFSQEQIYGYEHDEL